MGFLVRKPPLVIFFFLMISSRLKAVESIALNVIDFVRHNARLYMLIDIAVKTNVSRRFLHSLSSESKRNFPNVMFAEISL